MDVCGIGLSFNTKLLLVPLPLFVPHWHLEADIIQSLYLILTLNLDHHSGFSISHVASLGFVLRAKNMPKYQTKYRCISGGYANSHLDDAGLETLLCAWKIFRPHLKIWACKMCGTHTTRAKNICAVYRICYLLA